VSREGLPLLPAPRPDFAIAPPAQDRTAWKALPEFVAAQLMADGDAALAADYPQLTATHYLAYTRTGDRAGFEAGYFARRRLLNALILAECVEHDGRFLDRIVDGLLLLCEESGWQLPAHNAQVRNGARAALPDVTRPIIDLFAAETGAQLAVAAQMLGAELEIAAPGLVARIDAELERRIFTPYLTRHFWWMGNGDEPMNNWTAWCTQNLTIRAAVAPTAFAPLRAEPKLRNIAEYIVHMHVAGRRYFNFADSSAVVEGCGAREFLFGSGTFSRKSICRISSRQKLYVLPTLSRCQCCAFRFRSLGLSSPGRNKYLRPLTPNEKASHIRGSG